MTGRVAMPQKGWNKKRERQYEHIKGGPERPERGEDTAEEIASRTVIKGRARSGESRRRSRSASRDISSARWGGKRSHQGAQGRTKSCTPKPSAAAGRSSMSTSELERAVGP
ncbi:MAG: plasmid stabilization protein [Candidatus Limnocylindria bacterium]